MVLETAQADFGNKEFAALFLRGLAHAALPQAKADVLRDGEPGEKRVALKHHTPVGAGAVDGLAVELHLAAGGKVQARHNAQQGRLAATRRAEDGDEVVLAHFEINGQQGLGLLPLGPGKGARDAANGQLIDHRALQSKRRRLTALKAKSEISPMMPMTMMPKMIWPVLSSAWLSVIMWPMPEEEPISSATIT